MRHGGQLVVSSRTRLCQDATRSRFFGPYVSCWETYVPIFPSIGGTRPRNHFSPKAPECEVVTEGTPQTPVCASERACAWSPCSCAREAVDVATGLRRRGRGRVPLVLGACSRRCRHTARGGGARRCGGADVPVDTVVRGREDARMPSTLPSVAMVWSRFRPSAVRSSTVDCGTVPHAPTATTRRRCAKCHRRWSWAGGGADPARMGASGCGVWVSCGFSQCTVPRSTVPFPMTPPYVGRGVIFSS